MSPQHLLFIAVILVFVVLTASLFAVSVRRERASVETEWEQLVARLDIVNKDVINRIATDLLEERDEIAPETLYSLLGGLKGMDRIQENCGHLVELATYVQRWHPEAIVVAEELRLSAREISWHVERLRGAAAVGHLKSTFPDNAQQAIKVYYLMTRSVLSLCETYQDIANGKFAALQHAL